MSQPPIYPYMDEESSADPQRWELCGALSIVFAIFLFLTYWFLT